MRIALERGPGRGRGGRSVRTCRRGRARALPIAPVIVAAGLIGTSCLDSSVPLAPQCLTGIQIELSTEEIRAGDTFVATATSQSDECLTNLMWSGLGVISFEFAEASSATFHADESGTGTIRVMNDRGNLGVLEVTVEEGEDEGRAGMREPPAGGSHIHMGSISRPRGSGSRSRRSCRTPGPESECS